MIGGEGLFEALEELGLRPGAGPRRRPGGRGLRLPPRPAVEDRDRRRDPGAQRAALGRLQHRPDRARPRTAPGRATACWSGRSREFAGVDPVVAGKPEPPLFHETLRRVGGRRPLVVGDRLDTDIEGAVRAGYDSLLVMTGVTGLAELVRRGAGQPADVRLGGPRRAADAAHAARRDDGRLELGGWRADGRRAALWSSGATGRRRLVAGRGRGGLATTSTPRRAGRHRRARASRRGSVDAARR